LMWTQKNSDWLNDSISLNCIRGQSVLWSQKNSRQKYWQMFEVLAGTVFLKLYVSSYFYHN
jgi:hypothetical protein